MNKQRQFLRVAGLRAYLVVIAGCSGVSVSGYVLTQPGRAPRGAVVTLADLNGNR